KAWPCSTPAGSSASPSKDARSASQRGTVLHAERSPDHHRTLEDSLQHGPSAQQSRGPATRSRNYPTCELRTNMVGGTKTPGWSEPRILINFFLFHRAILRCEDQRFTCVTDDGVPLAIRSIQSGSRWPASPICCLGCS